MLSAFREIMMTTIHREIGFYHFVAMLPTFELFTANVIITTILGY